MKRDVWNKCDDCGRFISLDDFVSGAALKALLEPSSDLGVETWETLCKSHNYPTADNQKGKEHE